MKRQAKRLKIVLFVICIVSVVVYFANKIILNNSYDRTSPEITFDQDVLEVSTEVSDEDLLQGVTAVDGKDGDVTDSLMIESISNMLDGNERKVTYAAFDSDNHVGKNTRTIKYTDYTSPKFSLEEPFASIPSENYNNISIEEILAPLHASDCIDGDITSSIFVVQESSSMDSENPYVSMDVQVTNSSGDIAQITVTVPVSVESTPVNSANGQILLKEYLTYVKKGADFNPSSYIEEASFYGQELKKKDVDVKSTVDTDTPGTYQVVYTITPPKSNDADTSQSSKKDEEEEQTSVTMLVVVTE